MFNETWQIYAEEVFAIYWNRHVSDTSENAVATNGWRANEEIIRKHSIYLCLPKMLSEISNFTAADSLVREFSVAYYFHLNAVIFFDRIIDDAAVKYASDFLHNLHGAIRGYAHIFKPDEDFWRLLFRLTNETSCALVAENERPQYAIKNYEEFALVAEQRCALACLASSLLIRGGVPVSDVNKLQHSIRHLHIALQWLDDINDFQFDIIEAKKTPLTILYKEWAAGLAIDVHKLNSSKHVALCYSSGLWEFFTEKTLMELQVALSSIISFNLPTYHSYLRTLILQTTARQKHFGLKREKLLMQLRRSA